MTVTELIILKEQFYNKYTPPKTRDVFYRLYRAFRKKMNTFLSEKKKIKLYFCSLPFLKFESLLYKFFLQSISFHVFSIVDCIA